MIRFYYSGKDSGGSLKYKAFTWRRHGVPRVVSCEELEMCVEESLELVKKYLTHSQYRSP